VNVAFASLPDRSVMPLSDMCTFIPALLHKSADGRGSPFPGQTYPTVSVMGVPSAVKPFRNERANAIGSRERANDTDMELGDLTVEVPRAQALAQKFRFADLRFTQCILVSSRLLRW
jgi:hypothetical protein